MERRGSGETEAGADSVEYTLLPWELPRLGNRLPNVGRLVKLISTRSTPDMENRLEFLSDWGSLWDSVVTA
jgi:hypothetical protein